MRPRADVLVGMTIWRLIVAGLAWYGFDQVTGYSRTPPWDAYFGWEPVRELSQLGSLLVAICYLGLAVYPLFVSGRRHEPRRSWLRGALVIIMWLVSLTAIFIIGSGQLDDRGFLFEHLLTPVIVTVDFLVVGRGQDGLRWWYPLTWVLPPAVYFGYLATDDFDLYYGLFDPSDPVQIALRAAGFLVALVAVGYLLLGLGRLRVRLLGHDVPAAPGPVPAGQSAR
jgi:hypothetical protein